MDSKSSQTIKECILNIDMITRSFYLSIKDVIDMDIPRDSVIFGDMVRLNFISVCSVLDEISILNRLAKDDEYLRDTLHVISPIFRAINKYGIRKARNYLLAHYNRKKNKEFYPWWISLKGVRLPRTRKEMVLMSSWLTVAKEVLATRYYKELEEISEKSRIEVEEYESTLRAMNNKLAKEPTPLDNVEKEVYRLAQEKGIEKLVVDPIMKDDYLKHSKKM